MYMLIFVVFKMRIEIVQVLPLNWFAYNLVSDKKEKCHYSRVCPREDQAGVTHVISQMIKVIKLFKGPKYFGLPVSPWGTTAFTSNPRDKTPKLALKLYFQKRSPTLIECRGF